MLRSLVKRRQLIHEADLTLTCHPGLVQVVLGLRLVTPAEKQPILDGLIKNGLRNLNRGLSGFERDELDFAITDAFFGIEIVLKAMVFDRRWELIFADPSQADAAALRRGECRTVGCKDALSRLREDLGIALPASVAHVKRLEQHRNKLVHFFHPDLSSPKKKAAIAAELASGWATLRDFRRLPEFADLFNRHATDFGHLDGRLLVLDAYLDQQARILTSAHPHPDWLTECPACKRRTFDGECGVCGYHEPSHRAITQGDEMIGPADCPRCGGMQTVVVSRERARCTQPDCAAWFGAMHRCEYCAGFFVVQNEEEVVDDEDHAGVGSFYFGCPNCEGRAGELAGRDD